MLVHMLLTFCEMSFSELSSEDGCFFKNMLPTFDGNTLSYIEGLFASMKIRKKFNKLILSVRLLSDIAIFNTY